MGQQLLLVRHGIAIDAALAEKQGIADTDRPLTAAGIKRMCKIARGLHGQIDKLPIVASSPLLRAHQTAQILRDEYGNSTKLVEVPALSPGKPPASLLRWVRGQSRAKTLGLVGHEPDLSRWVSWLLTGKKSPLFDFKKGSACLVEFPKQIGPGKARLLWFLTPDQLRHLK